MKTVTVEVWSDFVCPWCWIAKKRFEKAVHSVAGQVQVVVTNKAYRLAKGMRPMDYKNALHQKLGGAAGADRMMTAVSTNGLLEGLVYNFDTMRFGDTTAAHALVKSISSPVLAQMMSERLYKAVTTDGLDIFDQAVLASLAKEVGVTDMLEFDRVRVASEIARDEAEANSIANGVPLFLLNGKTFLSGAREAVVFERALRDAAVDVPGALDETEGESCGIDGCH
ncbi:DSBA-like thioredoxin domain protein [Burkholderia ambifaria AMMD]|uniref:DSBA oxidoreductase n=1 Tax=Burkholderia ambifaria (strain ATCC BAA-244 / DSM 16087 / CCUG 44356 / LMG 19182 / AMMD) TaxID=339670 RepID=Q0BE88_BURCM|nr:DsbA family oxidoreductase [Burkholderia ambifaria]ABI87535.1 DSBA oxidoreductase [Burkholderia ambifaria AMMD]AJY20685.1 DSBA-like thioredoxin domain protein [Burkholderia ambifaria AMMD]MBR7929025.1 DsbA family oxidoreductase [Burkholderia ambifaria]PEH67339.1 DsbA family oxidoreductase [Burkholderia ambifaria]QQC05256.1 DsbA family oxidoreductase [Burkholderia ambifaria]